eukprot:gene3237-3718_t
MVAEIGDVLRGTARAATYNVILQVSFRLLTFVVNALVLRFVSSEVLGLVNVRLTLLYSTILFLSREAFRKACLSKPYGQHKRNWRQLINLTWCCVPVGCALGLLLAAIWAFCFEQPPQHFSTFYNRAIAVFAVSGVFELLAEPLWLVGQAFLFVRVRVLIEALALAVKCLSTISLIVLLPDNAVYAFCIAQSLHALCYVFMYYFYFTKCINNAYATNASSSVDKKTDEIECFPFQNFTDFLPNLTNKDGPLIDPSYAKLVYSFMKQSILKQFLTEGERYVMTIFNVISLGQQGVYDIVNNLGSLVARFVFLPIEESYYVLFCQLLARGKQQQDSDKFHIAGRTLKGVLKFVSLVGYIIMVFGFSYSYLLLDIYGGKLLILNEGPLLLRWYCVYVLIIAMNGITECFMFALMSKDEIDYYNRRMIGFSFAFLTAALFFTKFFGSVGFILANCLNMSLRIIHSGIFIRNMFADSGIKPLRGIIPSLAVCLSLATSFCITCTSEWLLCCETGWTNRLAHVGVGALCLFSVLLSVLFTEREFVQFLKEQWTGQHKQIKRD